MTITDAKNMLQAANIPTHQAQVWADLGCGSGTFTYALADLLAEESKIFAVDRSLQIFDKNSRSKVEIEFLQADFTQHLALKNLDGILMANALHFIKDKMKLIERFTKVFKEKPQFLIVEYDTSNANPWVPYPIQFDDLKTLFPMQKYSIEKVGERSSIYGHTMYIAHIKQYMI